MAASLGSTRQDRKKVADTSKRDICDQIERVRRWRDKIMLPATIYSLEISVEVELWQGVLTQFYIQLNVKNVIVVQLGVINVNKSHSQRSHPKGFLLCEVAHVTVLGL